jgi:hypothetical protein
VLEPTALAATQLGDVVLPSARGEGKLGEQPTRHVHAHRRARCNAPRDAHRICPKVGSEPLSRDHVARLLVDSEGDLRDDVIEDFLPLSAARIKATLVVVSKAHCLAHCAHARAQWLLTDLRLEARRPSMRSVRAKSESAPCGRGG